MSKNLEQRTSVFRTEEEREEYMQRWGSPVRLTDQAWFYKNSLGIWEKYPGQYVVVRDKKILFFHKDENEANRYVKELGLQPWDVFIEFVDDDVYDGTLGLG